MTLLWSCVPLYNAEIVLFPQSSLDRITKTPLKRKILKSVLYVRIPWTDCILLKLPLPCLSLFNPLPTLKHTRTSMFSDLSLFLQNMTWKGTLLWIPWSIWHSHISSAMSTLHMGPLENRLHFPVYFKSVLNVIINWRIFVSGGVLLFI